jgi:AAA15 family ATPase/GTPase
VSLNYIAKEKSTLNTKNKRIFILEELIKQLETYFQNSKKNFAFGLQNFQGIREFTEIPLAPLTLLYGQNSAGKSTIHDAIEFIYYFFSGESDVATNHAYLTRWANQNRKTDPLTKKFIGKSDDVVISVSTNIGESVFWEWEETHSNIRYSAQGVTDLLFNRSSSIPFRLDVHFSDADDWSIRQCRLFLSDEIFADFVFDDCYGREGLWDEYGLLKINKNHPVFALIDTYYQGNLENLSKWPYHNEGEEDGWFLFFDMDVNPVVSLKTLFNWYDVDQCLFDRKPTPEIIEFRYFLLSLIFIPAIAIKNQFNFSSVPPLRPIPSKQSAIVRLGLQSFDKMRAWDAVAEMVLKKFLNEKNSEGLFSGSFADLDKINRWLGHDHFLNTGYELTGQCALIVPGDLFFDETLSSVEKLNAQRNIEAEVHLKLINKANNCLVEIEDVGVGISQLIPVLLALTQAVSFRQNEIKAFIQQPELHLHPKLQSHLADALIESINDKPATIIAETHSEHILLRLLRRIRETYNSDIKNKLFGLSANDVSVLYVDKLADGSSKIFPLRIGSIWLSGSF